MADLPKLRRYADLRQSVDELLQQGRHIYSCDTVLLAELLLQLIARLDYFITVWQTQQYVMARTQPIRIGTEPTLIYRNSLPYPITLEVFNLDPAQTVFIGQEGVTVSGGVPVFPESGRRVTVEPGKSLYGIVEAGEVDVRIMSTVPSLLG